MTAHASVRGKIMLAGEYAVLRGGRALAVTTAPEYALHVELETHGSALAQYWSVDSTLWPETTKEIDLSCESLDGAEAAVASLLRREAHAGIDQSAHGALKITSNLDPAFGFGSSSALAIALSQAFHPERSALEHARTAWMWQQRAQGRASGYDALTQALADDMVMLAQPFLSDGESPWPHTYQTLPIRGRVTRHVEVFVGGRGAPTGQVLGATMRDLTSDDWARIQGNSENLIDAWLVGELAPLVAAIAAHRQNFAKSAHFPRRLFAELATLEGWDKSWTCKTTGAGGEDAMLFVGEASNLAQAEAVFQRSGWRRLEGIL